MDDFRSFRYLKSFKDFSILAYLVLQVEQIRVEPIAGSQAPIVIASSIEDRLGRRLPPAAANAA